MDAHTPIIEVRNVAFSYNGRPVLKEVNLTVLPGDFLAVIGPNGGGKTTLLKLMLGLLKPDRGVIRVFGKPPRRVSHRIGYVPQDIHINRGFPISALDVVLMGRLHRGGRRSGYSDEDRRAADRALERLEISNLRNRPMDELSGGQRQRVFVARALVSEPEILFLDEPTSSVDTKGQTDLFSILAEINETVTILVVTHDVSVIPSCFKSVACVNHGLFHHDKAEIPEGMLDMAYLCPVEVVAHGVPHRVLPEHLEDRDG